MRYTIILFLFLPILASGQSTAYQYAKRVDTLAKNRTVDTAITWQSAKVSLVGSTLMANGVTYAVTNEQDFVMDANDQYWSLLILNNGLTATIRRYSNQALMNVIIQGGEVDLYYYIL